MKSGMNLTKKPLNMLIFSGFNFPKSAQNKSMPKVLKEKSLSQKSKYLQQLSPRPEHSGSGSDAQCDGILKQVQDDWASDFRDKL
jgi:hypothetical protein